MYGIYANIGGILMGSMLPYIAAPWILWDIKPPKKLVEKDLGSLLSAKNIPSITMKSDEQLPKEGAFRSHGYP